MEILHSMLDTLSHVSPIALFFTITLPYSLRENLLLVFHPFYLPHR